MSPDAEDRYALLREGKSTFDNICFYTNKGKKGFFKDMALILTGSLIIAFIPFALGKFTDNMKALDWDTVSLKSGLILAVFSLILMYVAWYIFATVGRRRYILNIGMNKTRSEILRKIDSKDVIETQKHSAGKYVGYITNEQQVLARMMNNDVVIITEGAFLFIVMIILLAVTEIKLAATYLVLLPLSCYLIRRVVKSMKNDAKKRQKAFRRMNGYLDDVYAEYSLVRLYGLTDRTLEHFDEIDDDLSDSYKRVLNRASYVNPIGRIIENVGYIVSSFAGVLMLMNNAISIGMLLTFISYSSLIGKPLTNIIDGIGRLRENKISMNNISKLLVSEEDMRHGTIPADESDGDLSVKDVTLMFDESTVLDSVSFDIRYGEHVSIVGASGSGKTLLVDMMVALQKADEGSVIYGGRDVFEYERNSLRNSIRVCSTVPWLLTGTVMENILYVNPDATEEEAIAASKLIGFDEMVMRMKDGYDTIIGNDKPNTSLGERQMLSLVRLMLIDPKVVIFDDSFSALDALTVRAVKGRMSGFLKDRTVITVSDDVSDPASSERVLFLDNGRIIEGTHEALMSDSRYASVFDETI